MRKEYSFNKPAEEVYRNLKNMVAQSPDAPAELKNNLKWDDGVKSASIDYSGVQARFEITGTNPCALKVEISIGFPASLLIKEAKIAENMDRICTQL